MYPSNVEHLAVVGVDWERAATRFVFDHVLDDVENVLHLLAQSLPPTEGY